MLALLLNMDDFRFISPAAFVLRYVADRNTNTNPYTKVHGLN